MCLLDRKKILKMQTSHEMNEKGMERSIPSKLSTARWTSSLYSSQVGFQLALW